uniref:Exocyst subunit Exo70 family protein n=1 Tax=Arundo donax TaxID=35708 RepID=A0A0A9H925_ARUDO
MWVCASSHVDDVKLTREILQAATDWKVDYDWIVNFDRLQKLLVSAVAGRRFLLVLDDVWADKERSMWKNVERWRKLLAPLQNGKQESRIIVTTRMKMVADMLGVRIPMMLGGLGTKEYWSLRKKCALGSENSHEYLHLQEIGRKIALKLKGSKAYMNNFILQEVEQSDVRLIVGSRWIRKCQNRIKAYMNNYLSVSWGPVRSNLETAKSMSPSKRLRTNILIFLSASPPPLQNFVWSFSATCNPQMCWKVPSPVLRDELCVKILEFVIPAYHAHLESLKRSVRGTAEDFELELKSKISELFEG